ncbi:hypothetical protein [Silvibacterium sp.]|uniref:hypothetical protein n=1 Tax=Silvibacterium sp. TaxID=1964179 RepID=UPI0039E3B907
MRDTGASAGAEGVEDEVCPYMLDAPIPTAHPTSRIRLKGFKKRECMRLSSTTIEKSNKFKTCLNKSGLQSCHLRLYFRPETTKPVTCGNETMK